MSAQAEIDLDIEELTQLQETAVRPKVKEILKTEVEKLIKQKTPAAVKESSVTKEPEQPPIIHVATKTVVPPPKYYKDITTYAWDQSEKFMKLYVTINGVQNLPKENVTTEFKNKSFRLRAENVDGTNYQCHVAFLWEDIIPADSYHKVKTDCVLVMLKKSQDRKTWAYLTEREDNKKEKEKEKKKKMPKKDDKKDPNDSLMDMLKQMYEDGDDDMKRTIAKSFAQGRDKEKAATPTDQPDS